MASVAAAAVRRSLTACVPHATATSVRSFASIGEPAQPTRDATRITTACTVLCTHVLCTHVPEVVAAGGACQWAVAVASGVGRRAGGGVCVCVCRVWCVPACLAVLGWR